MTSFFVTVRALHVLLGAIWLGVVILMSLFLVPSVQEAGPAGGAVMMALVRRKLDAFIASIAGITVLSGIWLYWVLSNGFDPAIAGTMRMRIVGLGGVLGLLAAIIGGSVVARGMRRAIALMKEGRMDEAAQLRRRAASAGRLVMVLVLLAILCMTIGAHYV